MVVLTRRILPGFQFLVLLSPVTSLQCPVLIGKVNVMEAFNKVTQDEDNSTVPKCKVYVMVLFIQVAWEEDII